MYRLTEYSPQGQMITSTDVSDLQVAYAVQRDLAKQSKIALVTLAAFTVLDNRAPRTHRLGWGLTREQADVMAADFGGTVVPDSEAAACPRTGHSGHFTRDCPHRH